MRLGAMHQGGDDDDVTLLFYLQTPMEQNKGGRKKGEEGREYEKKEKNAGY